MRQAPASSDSVYDDIDRGEHRERAGFGRYSPYLVVDLHPLDPHGFTHAIALMKEQVKESDVADGQLVQSTSVSS